MAETPQIEQIIVEFFSKVAQTILESRILPLSRTTSSSASSSFASSSLSSSPPKGKDKWFNLNLGLSDNIMFPSIEAWNRTPTLKPMYVEILLSDVASTSRPIGQRSGSLLLERWAVQYVLDSSSSKSAGVERPVVYKKGVILLRSLYFMTRLLPAYKIYRELKKSPSNSRKIWYRISSMPEPLQMGRMQVHRFIPVETRCGKLCLSVHYLQATVDRCGNLGFATSVSSRGTQIIPDYCEGNAVDKRFQGTSRGKSDVSSAINSPGCRTEGIGRCHSWSGGINKVLTQQTALHRIGMNPRSFDPHFHVPMLNVCTPPLPMPKRQSNADSFRSFSPSPPMRSRLSNESMSSGLLLTGSMPISISSSSGVRSPQNFSAEHCVQSKNPLLYLSNKGRMPHLMSRAASANSKLMDTHTPASLESPPCSGKFVVSRTFDVQANLQAHIGDKDEKDESGSLSGPMFFRSGSSRYTVSRSSSKNSYNYEVEDEDLSCPFALDDDESDGYKSRAESLDEKGIMPEVMGASAQTVSAVSTPRRSQNAAVGALVEMLKSAPSLQQNAEKSSEISRSDSWMETSQGQNIAKEYGATRSSAEDFTPKKKITAEALRELEDYKEIKDCLLRQRGIPEIKRP